MRTNYKFTAHALPGHETLSMESKFGEDAEAIDSAIRLSSSLAALTWVIGVNVSRESFVSGPAWLQVAYIQNLPCEQHITKY